MKLMIAFLAAGLCGCLATAEPYWVAYEADDGLFPEEVGWERHFGGGGAQRCFEDGALVIDSLADQMIYDFYEIDRPVDPGPAETFVATWTLLVAEHYGYWQSCLAISRDHDGILGFWYTADSVRSSFEGWTLPIAPGGFHTYRIESADMVTYTFWVDDQYALSGTWYDIPGTDSYAGFGDGSHGGGERSLTKWSYFAFGTLRPMLGDANCDGAIDAFDIEPFVLALTDVDAYRLSLPGCDYTLADINQDGRVDVFDIDGFVELLLGAKEISR